jgi:hypothetical protein
MPVHDEPSGLKFDVVGVPQRSGVLRTFSVSAALVVAEQAGRMPAFVPGHGSQFPAAPDVKLIAKPAEIEVGDVLLEPELQCFRCFGADASELEATME